MAGDERKVTVVERTFTVVFEPSEEGGYIATVPAIPELATQGETLDEAREMAADMIAGYLEVLQDEGRPLPPEEEHRTPPLPKGITIRMAAE